MDRRHFLQAIGGVLAAIGAGQFLPSEWGRVAGVQAAPVKEYTAEELVAELTKFTETTPYDLEASQQTAHRMLLQGHYHTSTAWLDHANLSAGTWQGRRVAHISGNIWTNIGEPDNEPHIWATAASIHSANVGEYVVHDAITSNAAQVQLPGPAVDGMYTRKTFQHDDIGWKRIE